jgi:hypothetical protein
MTERRVPTESPASEEIPEADAVEQRTELVDLSDPADVDDDERVVALDEDEYR